MKENEKIVSVMFYKEGGREFSFDRLLKKGDTIVDIEFNTDTQLFDLLVREEDMEVRYYGSPETGYAASVGYKAKGDRSV